MEIYDVIHGNIKIDEIAKKIIDTEEFQRLRSIKQLGCCNYIFPSAVHTRFEHSIGVYYLANKYIDILNTDGQFTENDRKCITIGALIHDLGHGPYSHLFDEIVSEEKNHEYRSIEMLKHMNTKYSFGLTEEDISKINIIIYPEDAYITNDKKFVYQIVSNKNGIDVDRFDYIVRDIKMTGLNYGIEYERIMNNSYINDGEIVYSEKVKTSIEEFFRIRFIMYKEVYNHHTVRSIEYMMKEYIQGIDKILNINETIQNNNWDDFMKLNDSIIDIIYFINKDTLDTLTIVDLNYGKDGTVSIIDGLKELIQKIRTRNIYKSVGEIITDSVIHLEGYNRGNIIIDTVRLSLNGEETCKYVKARESVNKSLTIQGNDKYVTCIYYKKEEYKDDAIQLFEKLKKL
tara:strand:- start:5245 stop:6447 length:1203 start_codon:yes stop_codon:yes gene_type:complete